MRVKASRRRPASKKPKVMKKQRRTKKMLRTKRVRRGGLTDEQLLALSKLCATGVITGSLGVAGWGATTGPQKESIMGIVQYVLDSRVVGGKVLGAYGGDSAVEIIKKIMNFLGTEEGSAMVKPLVTPTVVAAAVVQRNARPLQAAATTVQDMTTWSLEKCRQIKDFIQRVVRDTGATLRSNVPLIDDCAVAIEVMHSLLTSAFLIIFTAINSSAGDAKTRLTAVLRELEEDNAHPDGADSQASSQASTIISLASSLTITSGSNGRDIVVRGVDRGPAAAEGAAAEGADSQSLGFFPEEEDRHESQPPAPPGRGDQSPRAAAAWARTRGKGGPEGSGSERRPGPY